MKRRICFFLLCCLSSLTSLFAQHTFQKAAYFELGGIAFKSGVGYDIRSRSDSSKWGWSAHGTINEGGLLPSVLNYGNLYAPVSLGGSILYGTSHCVEVGASVRPRLHYIGKENPLGAYTAYKSVSLDIAPFVGYRYQPKNKDFFLKFYVIPISLGELSDGRYGSLNWFPLSEVQSSLAGLDLGFSLNEATVSTPRKTMQHSVFLDFNNGLNYDIRFNQPSKKISYALGVALLPSIIDNPLLRTVSLRASALFGQERACLEVGLQATYVNTSFSYLGYIPNRGIVVGVPLGFRYQYARSGFFARAYVMPSVQINQPNYIPNIGTSFGLGYTF